MAEVRKKFAKKVRKYYKLLEGGEGGEGGWRIVIPMPERLRPSKIRKFTGNYR
jgi:hypothetical protein